MQYHVHLVVILLVALGCASSVNASRPCGPTPQSYQSKEFGDALFAIKKPCSRTFTQTEQTVIAGMASYFFQHCKLPSNLSDKQMVLHFLKSQGYVATMGGQHSGRMTDNMKDQVVGTTAWQTGFGAAQELGCSERGKKVAGNIVDYLNDTRAGPKDRPGFVDGCVSYYRGAYSRKNCQCMADTGRAIYPDIYEQRYDPMTVKRMIQAQPMLGFTLTFQCGIGDY